MKSQVQIGGPRESARRLRSDFRIAAVSGLATSSSVVSMLVLSLGLDPGSRRHLALLAPMALFQSVLEAGAVYEYLDPTRVVLAGLYGRLMVCSLATAVFGIFAFAKPNDALCLYLILVSVKALYAIGGAALGSLTQAIETERWARVHLSAIGLSASAFCLARKFAGHVAIELQTWISLQIALLFACALYFVCRPRTANPVGLVYAAGRQSGGAISARELYRWTAEKSVNYLTALAGLGLYAVWPLVFTFSGPVSIAEDYKSFGLLYIGLSIALPTLTARVLQGRIWWPVQRLLGVYLTIALLGGAAVLLGACAGRGPAPNATSGAVWIRLTSGSLLVVNEVFSAVTFPLYVFGRRNQSLVFVLVLMGSAATAFLAATALQLTFACYVALLSILLAALCNLCSRSLYSIRDSRPGRPGSTSAVSENSAGTGGRFQPATNQHGSSSMRATGGYR